MTRNFTTYTIKRLSTSTGTPTSLGLNANHTFNSSKGLITLLIWNIQTSNAGYYSLSVSTGASSEVNSAAVLFVYASISASAILAVGRNPGFESDTVELTCSNTSYSLPVAERPRLYYTWHNSWYGSFRNISSGAAVLRNGDVLPGYSIKNDGKTFVIASAQFTDTTFYCSVQEEGSPYKSAGANYPGLTIYSKPFTYSFSPVSRKFNAAPYSSVYLSFNYQATPPLISYSNWNFVNASGNTAEYPGVSNPAQFYLSFVLYSMNSYGSYSVTLANSNGSRTEMFEVLAPGPPDTPSNISLQYVTHNLVSPQWRCMWFNGAQQTVFSQLTDVATNTEVETQTISLATNCYNSVYSTLFQSDIHPETDYEVSIWSVNTYGSSDVANLAVRTPKRIIFNVAPADISIMESQATINFRITDSTKAVLWLNVSCCVEMTTQCSNKSYTIGNTDNQIVFDILPNGDEYVFDFIVYDSDGYTYIYTLAIVKGIRVSRTGECNSDSCVTKKNPMEVAVIVLAVLLGVAFLALIGFSIGFFVCKRRWTNNTPQQSANPQPPQPTRKKPDSCEQPEYSNAEDNYDVLGEMDLSKGNEYYTDLETNQGRAKVNRSR